MKRVALIVLGALALALLGAAGAVALALSGSLPLPASADLPGGGRLIKDGPVSAYLLPAGPDAYVLVDCGDDPTGKAILEELGRRNAEPTEVKAILLTHGHRDHVGGCHLFPGADVLGFQEDAALAEGKASSSGPLTRFFKVEPGRGIRIGTPLKDGESFMIGELKIQAFKVPGHTAGSAAYLASGVLFLGDSANATTDGTLAAAPWPFTDDPGANRASLRELGRRLEASKEEVRVLTFSHSAPLGGLAALQSFSKGKE